MIRVFLFLPFCLFAAVHVYGQSLWTPLSREAIAQFPDKPYVLPDQGRFYALDYSALVNTLKNAKTGTILLPSASGELVPFTYTYSPVYEAELQTKYPDFATFSVYEKRNPANRGRIDYTANGFHAAFSLDGAKIIIDPVYQQNRTIYAVYNRASYFKDPADQVPFDCLVEEHGTEDDANTRPKVGLTLRNALVELVEYRIAIATTGEYAQYHGGVKALVLSELVSTVNRLNDVYENDLGVRLILVADNDKIIFLDPATDGYTNGFPGSMINENPGIINMHLSLDDYDIGHVFGVATAGGTVGLATTPSVCTTSKARAMSSYFTPKFDPFYINIVAHELGHQFSARHSFNKCDNMNENPATGWEPGSGSTIMSYAGSCGTNNVQDLSDPYFHGGSLEGIRDYITVGEGSTCGNRVLTTNEPPEITHGYTDGFYIPISTPFKLQAAASDPNNDMLTYSWEQMDTGPISDAGSPQLNSPLFRSYAAGNSSSRTFPQLIRIIQNQPFGKFEVLPTYSRDMTFRFTVRDNNPEAGSFDQADVAFKATNLAGPFVVTSFNSVDTVHHGEYVEINWDPANTHLAPVNSECVNIRLSTDGGLNMTHLLAENVPNTGSFFVTFPKITTTSGRIQVEPSDNIYFDISNGNLRILPPLQAGYSMDVRPYKQIRCIPESANWTISSESLLGFAEEITWSVESGLPNGAIVSFSQNQVVPPASVEMTLDLSGATETGSFTLIVRGETPGGLILLRPVTLDVYREDYSTLDALNPLSGASSVSTSPLLSWVPQADATYYTVELATSPAFGGSTILSQGGLTATQYQVQIALEESTLYFWRVIPENICGQAENVPVFAFHTFTLSCAESSSTMEYNISAQGLNTIESPITLSTGGTVGTIRIQHITGNHQNIGNLRGSLKGPGGKTVKLFSNQCFFISGNIDFGVNDDSQVPLTCPPDNGDNYKSVELLSAFTGDPLNGTWNLVIEDLFTGSGGKITGWTLEFCSDVALNAPSLIVNDTLYLKPASQKTISAGLLLTTDPDNGPQDLAYTIVRNPLRGTLSKSGAALNVGDRFTQQDIYDGLISYQHGSMEEETDNFLFTVEDGQGGWLGIASYGIRTDETVSVSNVALSDYEMHIWPNPTRDEVYIRLNDLDFDPDDIYIFNHLGQLIPVSVTRESGSQVRMETRNLPSGLYFIQVLVQGEIIGGKVSIAR